MTWGYKTPQGQCNALAGVKAKCWRMSSQSGVGRVTCSWQQRGGRAPYLAVLLCTSTTRGMTQDGRLSFYKVKRDRSRRRSAQRRRRVSDEAFEVTHTLLRREARWESSVVYKGIALRQVFERIALRSGQGSVGNAQPDY